MTIKRLCACAFVLLQLVSQQLLTDALPVDALQPQHNRRGHSHIPGMEALRQRQRSRRRVGDVDTSGPTEYMQKLYSTLADNDGRPRNVTYDPTDIWCILDKDVLEGNFRQKPNNKGKCTAVNRFVFSWHSLTEAQQQLVQKGVLRAYLEVIPRFLAKQNTIPVDITVTAKLYNDADSHEVLAGKHHLVVTADSSGWVELNVTEGLIALWPPSVEDSEIEFTITLRVNCKLSKKVPASFIDLTTIPLSQAKRRERHMKLQPMLLIFIDDEELKELIRSEEVPVHAEGQTVMIDENFEETSRGSGAVDKRSTDGSCDMDDFMVNFDDLRLFYIIAPHSYNARRCSGSCSHSFLKRHKDLGTNHAKIMASAHLIHKQQNLFPHPPKQPCCVPLRYSSLSLFIRHFDGSVQYKLYPSMTVEECGCR